MQETLPYSPKTAGQLVWQQVMPLLRTIAGRVGQKVIAIELEVTEGIVSEVLNPEKVKRRSKNGRRIAGEWLPVFLRLANHEERAAILAMLAGDVGFVVERRRALTPEEENVRMRAYFEREAPGLLRAYDREER